MAGILHAELAPPFQTSVQRCPLCNSRLSAAHRACTASIPDWAGLVFLEEPQLVGYGIISQTAGASVSWNRCGMLGSRGGQACVWVPTPGTSKGKAAWPGVLVFCPGHSAPSCNLVVIVVAPHPWALERAPSLPCPGVLLHAPVGCSDKRSWKASGSKQSTFRH